MLKALLKQITQGGTWTVESLARELETSPQMIQAMVQDLARRGYLKPAQQACSGACASCPVAGRCIKSSAQTVWTWQGSRKTTP